MVYPNFLPGWETVAEIGKGGFSRVYKIKKKDDSAVGFYSALKVIDVPSSPEEYDHYIEDGCDEKSMSYIFKDQVNKIVTEFELMSSFKGTANIVSYEDHMITEKEDGRGYRVLIRMELLDTLASYLKNTTFDEEKIIKLGIDICNALRLCSAQNIVHRDIKPQNIFVNKFGDFKLGDFGIARVMEQTERATKIGTYSYISPEVYRGAPYNSTADIYSLGLVLYWLLNERRLPFMPLPPEAPTPTKAEVAMESRLGGKIIPPPKYGCSELKNVVLKACAYSPRDRFTTADEFGNALENIKHVIKKGQTVSQNTGEVLSENAGLVQNISTFEAEHTYESFKKISPDVEKIEPTVSAFNTERKSPAFLPNEKLIVSQTTPLKKKSYLLWGGLILFFVFSVIFGAVVLNELGILSFGKQNKTVLASDGENVELEDNSVGSVTEDDLSDNELHWSLNDGTLVINGKGEMPDYTEEYAPWKEKYSEIKKVVISKGVTSISNYAFYGCISMKSVTIPDSIVHIGEMAFHSCVSLEDVEIPNSVARIEKSAFYGCSALKKIDIPDSVASLGEMAFHSCESLTEIKIPEKVAEIKERTFYECSSLESVSLPDSLSTIEQYAFYNCAKLRSVSVPEKVSAIGRYAFYGCRSLEMAELSNELRELGEWAFAGCEKLSCVSVPEGVSKIGDFCFCGDLSLEIISLFKGLNSIGEGAFRGCVELKNIKFDGSSAEWKSVTKGNNWDYNTPSFTVECSD